MNLYYDDTPLTTGEAGRVARVSRVTVLRWIDKGYLTCTRNPSGHRRIKYGDLRALLDGKTTAKEQRS